MRPDLITSTDRARARGAKKIKPPQPGVRIPRQLRIRWYLYLYTCGKVTPEKCTVGIQCSLDAAEESNFVEQSSECPNTTQLRSRSSRKRFRKLEECKDINAQKVRWSTSRIMQRYACHIRLDIRPDFHVVVFCNRLLRLHWLHIHCSHTLYSLYITYIQYINYMYLLQHQDTCSYR